MTEKLLVRIQSGKTIGQCDRPEECLSDRELEVFQLIGQGIETQEIATRLKVSPKTIETYRFRIKEKLGISDGKELYRRALHWVEENGG